MQDQGTMPPETRGDYGDGTYSPTRQEMVHMKPSNLFQDITEDEFNKREAEKNEYKNELQRQMQEHKAKKA